MSIVTVTNSSAKNFHLIRYADVLLWYAEALIETGNHKEAGKYINQVRARAANGYVKAADPNNGMAETTSSYVLEDKVNGKTLSNAALTTVSAYIPILNSLPKHLRRKRYVGNVRLRWLLKVTAGMIWLAGVSSPMS